ncbi:effector-associated constant component EACC1 [Streptomyces tricolor]|uniref:effector-associated constant component EACC1 n=1 Tax=Streptomyces tricolor TaxID=68277 RepID=UPI0036EEC71A
MRIERAIEISAGEGGGRTIPDLYRWLRSDPRVRGYAAVRLGSSQPVTGTMGAWDVVDIVFGQATAAANLALSYAAWRTTRPAAPAVTFTADGRSITVRGTCDEATVRLITELVNGTASPSRPAAEGARQLAAEGTRQRAAEGTRQPADEGTRRSADDLEPR